MLEPAKYTQFAITLLAMFDPLGAVPIFLSLVHGYPAHKVRRIAWAAPVAAVIILVGGLFFGVWLLKVFGITIDSFRVAGGLVILLQGLAMSVHAPDRSLPGSPPAQAPVHDDSIAVVPLAVPFLAGPGSISLVLVFTHADPSTLHDVISVGILVLLGLLTWLTFRIAPAVARLVGPRGMKTATRLMSLVIAAMGVELMAQGLLGLFPGLK